MAVYIIDKICLREHSYYRSELGIKYPDIGNGLRFVSVSTWEKSVNTFIGRVEMLFSPRALKSL